MSQISWMCAATEHLLKIDSNIRGPTSTINVCCQLRRARGDPNMFDEKAGMAILAGTVFGTGST